MKHLCKVQQHEFYRTFLLKIPAFGNTQTVGFLNGPVCGIIITNKIPNDPQSPFPIHRPGTTRRIKKLKSFSIVNALLIGFLAGIIFYSIAKNSWGMVTIIPLYFIYKLVNDPKNKRSKELEVLLKERNLK